MLQIRGQLTGFIFRFLILLLLFTLCRVLFILINGSEFKFQSAQEFAGVLVGGIRFDITALSLVNGIYIFLYFFPQPYSGNIRYRKVLAGLFFISNGFLILMNLVDVAYYPFVHKRMQYDALLFLSGKKGNDFFVLLPTFLMQFWYLWLIYALLIYLMVKGYRWASGFEFSGLPSVSAFIRSALAFVAIAALSVLGMRGGFQLKPLDIIHASEMTSVQFIPAILNSPFSVMKTMDKRGMAEVAYYSDKDISDLHSGIHLPVDKASFKPDNVVVIIIESLSRKYIGFYNPQITFTPFLDSLFTQSKVYEFGFANAKESIQGIPAILSSIPSWQDDPFIFSPFASNRITSLPSLLKEKGYNSAFFHGGSSGTMGFDSYCRLAGFDSYYSRKEYGNDADFDGDWGIWDEPFLQFMAKNLSTRKQPFVASVFTLNTHHPFQIPLKYKQSFTQPGHPFFTCVRYADYALQQFFNTASKQPWFKNTLFVITADHTGPNFEEKGFPPLDDYRIPVAFYHPREKMGVLSKDIINQVDILPEVLEVLNYDKPYFSLGNPVTPDNFSVDYNSGVYQYIDSSWCYQFNGRAGIALYDWKKDPMFRNNLIKSIDPSVLKHVETRLKKRIQLFNNAMIRNQMWAEKIPQVGN